MYSICIFKSYKQISSYSLFEFITMAFEILMNDTATYATITLKDVDGGCTAEVYAFGGLLNAFTIPINDSFLNVVDGFLNVQDAIQNITNGYKSTKLSPFVCRMKHGSYSFHQKEYTVQKSYLGVHAIHGILFDAVFEIKNCDANNDKAEVELFHHYTATDAGYPFNFEITVTYTLEANNKLSIATSIIHQNEFPIPYADGWHPYFTLGENVDDCTLEFDSNTTLEFDDNLIPTGKLLVDNRFAKEQQLKNISLDNCFVLDPLVQQPQCVFKGSKAMLMIKADTAYPYLQIYTPPHRQSIAIENLSAAPDAFNNGIGLQLLLPNQPYIFSTSYQATQVK
jgi:aldose 1-epimerase